MTTVAPTCLFRVSSRSSSCLSSSFSSHHPFTSPLSSSHSRPISCHSLTNSHITSHTSSASQPSRTFSTQSRVRRYARSLLSKLTPEAVAPARQQFLTGVKPKFQYTPQQLARRTYPLRKVWRRREFMRVLQNSSFVFVLDFGGSLDLSRKNELRQAHPNIHFFESSNSIFRNVVENTPYWGIAGLLSGPCHMIYAKNHATVVEDIVTVFEMLEANPSWILFGGMIGESPVSFKDLERIKSYGTTGSVTSSVIPQLQSPRHQLFQVLQSQNHLLFRILNSRVKTLQGGDSATTPAPDATATPTPAQEASSP